MFSDGEGLTSNQCQACPAGKWASRPAWSACKNCTVGKYQNQTQSTACVSCEAGSHNPNKGSGQPTACEDCSAGWYAPGTYMELLHGASKCTACTPGKYSPLEKAVSEEVCISCNNPNETLAALAGNWHCPTPVPTAAPTKAPTAARL